jgi:polyhydroxyalkanoate synthesis regulator protein
MFDSNQFAISKFSNTELFDLNFSGYVTLGHLIGEMGERHGVTEHGHMGSQMDHKLVLR